MTGSPLTLDESWGCFRAEPQKIEAKVAWYTREGPVQVVGRQIRTAGGWLHFLLPLGRQPSSLWQAING